jgi:hypothetical protein
MKKKLKEVTPRTEARIAGFLPQRIAAKRTTSKKARATVVELIWPRNGISMPVTATVPNNEPQ